MQTRQQGVPAKVLVARYAATTCVALLLFLAIPVPASRAQEASPLDLNRALMENTFQVRGEGSSGTAFLLARKHPDRPELAQLVLITAAHVFTEMKGEYGQLSLRRKTHDDQWVESQYRIHVREGQRKLWTEHPAADIAVLIVRIPKELTPATILSIDWLASDEMLKQYGLHPGDELNTLGYPLGLSSPSGRFPILRSGKIASMVELPTTRSKVFLMDFEVFPGNSGGPVYFSQPLRVVGHKIHFRPSETGIQFIVGLVSRESVVANRIPMGLAEVIHASVIREAIDQLPFPPAPMSEQE